MIKMCHVLTFSIFSFSSKRVNSDTLISLMMIMSKGQRMFGSPEIEIIIIIEKSIYTSS